MKISNFALFRVFSHIFEKRILSYFLIIIIITLFSFYFQKLLLYSESQPFLSLKLRYLFSLFSICIFAKFYQKHLGKITTRKYEILNYYVTILIIILLLVIFIIDFSTIINEWIQKKYQILTESFNILKFQGHEANKLSRLVSPIKLKIGIGTGT